MSEFNWHDVWIQGGNILIGILGLLLSRAVAWLGTKIKGDWDDKILARARVAALSAVQEVYQTYVEAIKEAQGDGKLSAEEKQQAKHLAIDSAKSFLGFKGLKLLAKVIGVGDEILNTFLGSQVEASINTLKMAGSGSGNPS